MIRNSIVKIICLLLIIGLNWTGISTIGQTLAGFSDTENSSENIYTAGILDLEVSPANFDWQSPLPSPGSNNTLATSTMQLTNAGSLDFKFKITVSGLTGDLCSYLRISTSTEDAAVPLSEFNFQGEINSGSTQEFNFGIYLSEEANLGPHEEKSCNFKFSISAWQKEPEGMNENNGFNDSEEVSINIRLMDHYKEWLEEWLENLGLPQGGIVINEFLPISGEFPEFIELYNKGDSTMDISGWKVCYTDEISIPSLNWCKSSIMIEDNNIQISPGEFYVVYPGGNWIGDDKGIISLWKKGSIISFVLVDAHAYDESWGDEISADKSFARIPDGSENWYDPIPTPGGPNQLEPTISEVEPDSTTPQISNPEQNGNGGKEIVEGGDLEEQQDLEGKQGLEEEQGLDEGQGAEGESIEEVPDEDKVPEKDETSDEDKEEKQLEEGDLKQDEGEALGKEGDQRGDITQDGDDQGEVIDTEADTAVENEGGDQDNIQDGDIHGETLQIQDESQPADEQKPVTLPNDEEKNASSGDPDQNGQVQQNGQVSQNGDENGQGQENGQASGIFDDINLQGEAELSQ